MPNLHTTRAEPYRDAVPPPGGVPVLRTDRQLLVTRCECGRATAGPVETIEHYYRCGTVR